MLCKLKTNFIVFSNETNSPFTFVLVVHSASSIKNKSKDRTTTALNCNTATILQYQGTRFPATPFFYISKCHGAVKGRTCTIREVATVYVCMILYKLCYIKYSHTTHADSFIHSFIHSCILPYCTPIGFSICLLQWLQ
jgi:hypothetical protein